MSVVSTNEKRTPRGSRESLEGREYDRPFHVITDDVTDGAYVVAYTNSDIPNIGDEHPDDESCVVESIDPVIDTTDDDGTHWIVTVHYGTRKDWEETTYPWEKPDEIQYGWAGYQTVMDHAYAGGDAHGDPTDPIENSAGDPFDPPVMEDMYNLVLTITRTEKDSVFSPQEYAKFKNTINSKRLTVGGVQMAPYEGRIRELTMQPREITIREGSVDEYYAYWEIVITLEVRWEGWIKKILDQGFRELRAGEPHQIMMADIATLGAGEKNTEIKTPVKLKNGVISLADPDYLEFQTLFAKDWEWLRLPPDSRREYRQ